MHCISVNFWHVSMEAKLIPNKFLVYRTLCIQIKIIKKKKEKCSNRKQNAYFLNSYANMASLVTRRLFSAFKGEDPVFLSDINF